MPLDKLTLHAQLALLAQNATALDNAIAEKTRTLQQVATDLEHTRGARQYHELLVQQINNQLVELDRVEKAAVATPPSTT